MTTAEDPTPPAEPAPPHPRMIDYATWTADALDNAIDHRDVFITDLDDLIERLESRIALAKGRRDGYVEERTAMRVARATTHG